MTYFDIRVAQGNRLGNYTTNDPAQGVLLPKATFEHIQDLGPGMGRVKFDGELLSVLRGADQTKTYGGVPYVTGYDGNKQHLMLEAGWENQYIAPGGVAITPYLGARLDATRYDRTISAIPAPYAAQGDFNLLSVTPIAAMDFRWPLLAKNGADSHLLEPIAQLVYRGSSTTLPGVTNDDSQSFVFDTTNLFTYNHFSGIDRQDTGLRANLGGHYLANFADGSWLDLVAGESFHLLGTNGLGVSDPSQAGTSTGLGSTASYIVASARGGFSNGLEGGAKMQLDPSKFRVTRAGVGVDYTPGRFSVGGDYIYIAANPALGTLVDQHEIEGRTTIPVADYWSVNGDLTFNLATAKWTNADAGITYDDGYLVLGGTANVKPDSWGVGVKFNLKGPDGASAF
jgi:LPS-assembly protein